MKLTFLMLAAMAVLFCISCARIDANPAALSNLEMSHSVALDYDIKMEGSAAVIYAVDYMCPADCEEKAVVNECCGACDTKCDKIDYCENDKQEDCYVEEKPVVKEGTETEIEIKYAQKIDVEFELEFEATYNKTYKAQDEEVCKSTCKSGANHCYSECCYRKKEEKKQLFIETALDIDFEMSFEYTFQAKFKQETEAECKNECQEDNVCYDKCCEKKKEAVKEEYKEVFIEKKLEVEFELAFEAKYQQTHKATVESECKNECEKDDKCYDDCCKSRKAELKAEFEEEWKNEKKAEEEEQKDKKKLKYKKKTDKKMKYDLNLTKEGAKLVVNNGMDAEGKYKFKLSIKQVCEYRPDDIEGFQIDGGDEIVHIYGAGEAALQAESNFQFTWNFSHFEASASALNASRDNELRATTLDGIFGIFFRINPTPAEQGNVKIALNDLKFDFAVDVLKLRAAGWFNETGTELAIVAGIESKLKHRICEEETDSGAVCIEDEEQVDPEAALFGYVQWVKSMQCDQGASADLKIKATTLEDHEAGCDSECKKEGSRASALSWSMDVSQVDGMCIWDPVVKAYAVEDKAASTAALASFAPSLFAAIGALYAIKFALAA